MKWKLVCVVVALCVAQLVFAQSQPGDYESSNIGVLRHVPGGTFHRDSGAGNTTTVSEFRIGAHEVTREQFAAVMGTDPSNARGSSGLADPVQRVNWYHAIAFCNVLSLREGLEPVYVVAGVDFSSLDFAAIPKSRDAAWDSVAADWSANGYRLPTEAEWMWAAMGATDAPAKAFAGAVPGARLADYVWYMDNSGYKTHPVGTKKPNEIGLYDMSGNVQEWCWDWSAAYPDGSLTDYRGPATGSARMRRGGSETDPDFDVRVGMRFTYGYPNSGDGHIGFRVVRR